MTKLFSYVALFLKLEFQALWAPLLLCLLLDTAAMDAFFLKFFLNCAMWQIWFQIRIISNLWIH